MSAKKAEKYLPGYILENKGSIRYHCKMEHLDLYFPKNPSKSATLPPPKKIIEICPPPPPIKKLMEPRKTHYE